jgi:hypothetical protein
VSTAERIAAEVPASAAPSLALVPMVGDRAPRIEASPGVPKPVNAHRFFYVLGYLGLVPIFAAGWVGAFYVGATHALYPIGIFFVGLGGFGVLIHTFFRPNERKIRHLLLAIASLVLVIASGGPVRGIAREVHAASMASRLQPLAEALARDARIRNVGMAGEHVRLNGFHGRGRGDDGWLEGPGQPKTTLGSVLARDQISRGELQAYTDGLNRAGISDAERTPAGILFTPAQRYDTRLLYLPPGQALPAAHTLVVDSSTGWYSEPLGGGWYVVLSGVR